MTCVPRCVVPPTTRSLNYMIDYHRNRYRRTKTCKWRLGSMVTCDVESKWYSRKPTVVVYWMSILLSIHNECRTKFSTSAKFALKGTLICKCFIYLVYFSLSQLELMISSVGIAADYGLDGPGSNPGGKDIFRPSIPALGPTQPPVL